MIDRDLIEDYKERMGWIPHAERFNYGTEPVAAPPAPKPQRVTRYGTGTCIVCAAVFPKHREGVVTCSERCYQKRHSGTDKARRQRAKLQRERRAAARERA